MSKNWKFRLATPDDLTTLVQFQKALALESEKLELNETTLRKGIQAVFRQSAIIGDYGVVEEEGKLIGCLLLQKEWSDWRAKWVYWIHSLYVVPEKRREGVFTYIYDELHEKISTDPEAGGIRLYVDLRNEKAQKAYERMGMSKEHYSLYEWLKDA
jgi:RimJ/RimL family protein N-acetyltransferase